jgi:hypothetical protein
MFDIFATHQHGTTQLLVSVSCLTQAQDMACGLSRLIPGVYFGYFERVENITRVAAWEVRAETRNAGCLPA